MNTQKGSAHAVIIIGLVIALIGALGFIFWQNFLQNDDARETRRSVSESKPAEEPQVKPDYLVYENWNVRQTMEKSGEETYVKESEDDSYTIHSKTIDTGCREDSTQLGFVQRMVADEQSEDDSLLQGQTPREVFGEERTTVIIDTYLYRIVPPQGSCVDPFSEEGKATIRSIEAALDAFTDDFQTLETVE